MKEVEAKVFIGDLEEVVRDLDTAVSLHRIYSDDHIQLVEAVKRTHFGFVKHLTDWESHFPFINFTQTDAGLWATGIEVATVRPLDVFNGLITAMRRLEIRDINLLIGLEEREVLAIIRLFSLNSNDPDPESYLRLNTVDHVIFNQLALSRPIGENGQSLIKYLKGQMSLEEKFAARPRIRELVTSDPDLAASVIQTSLLWVSASKEGHSASEVQRWFKFMLGSMIEEVFGHIGWTQESPLIAGLLRRLEPEFIQSALAHGKDETETGWLDDRVLVDRFLESYREQQHMEAVLHRRMKMVERLLKKMENPVQASQDPDYRKDIQNFLDEIAAVDNLRENLWIKIAEVAPQLCYVGESEAGYRCLKTVLDQVLGLDISPENARRFWLTATQCLEALRASSANDQLPFLLTEFLAALAAIPPELSVAEKLNAVLVKAVGEWVATLNPQEYLKVAWRWIDRLESYVNSLPAALLLLRLTGDMCRSLIDAELYHEASSVQERLESLLGQVLPDRIRAEILGAIEASFRAHRLNDMFERMVAERRRDRLEAIQELQELGGLAKRAAFARLRDPDWHVRRNSLIVVEPSGTQADLPVLLALADDPVWQVRREAVRTVATILERVWTPSDRALHRTIVDLVKARLLDENFQVKSEVIKLIRNLNLYGVSNLLMQLFDENESALIPREVPLQAEILSALAAIANAHSEECKVIIRFMADIIKRKEGFLARRKSQESKEHALRALTEINDERAKAELGRILSKLSNSALKRMAKDALDGKDISAAG